MLSDRNKLISISWDDKSINYWAWVKGIIMDEW